MGEGMYWYLFWRHCSTLLLLVPTFVVADDYLSGIASSSLRLRLFAVALTFISAEILRCSAEAVLTRLPRLVCCKIVTGGESNEILRVKNQGLESHEAEG